MILSSALSSKHQMNNQVSKCSHFTVDGHYVNSKFLDHEKVISVLWVIEKSNKKITCT